MANTVICIIKLILISLILSSYILVKILKNYLCNISSSNTSIILKNIRKANNHIELLFDYIKHNISFDKKFFIFDFSNPEIIFPKIYKPYFTLFSFSLSCNNYKIIVNNSIFITSLFKYKYIY